LVVTITSGLGSIADNTSEADPKQTPEKVGEFGPAA